MNGKRAKALRRVARDQNIGKPEVKYTTGAEGKVILIPQLRGDPIQFQKPDQVVVDKGCERYTYRQMKRYGVDESVVLASTLRRAAGLSNLAELL